MHGERECALSGSKEGSGRTGEALQLGLYCEGLSLCYILDRIISSRASTHVESGIVIPIIIRLVSSRLLFGASGILARDREVSPNLE